MTDYGREWERLTERVRVTALAAQRVTGKHDLTIDGLRTHVEELRRLLSDWEQRDKAVYEIKESDA